MDMLKQKMLRNPEQIPYATLQTKIESINQTPIKTIACLAYATGARASELNQIKKQDLIIETIDNTQYLTITVKVLKKRKIKKYSETGKHTEKTKDESGLPTTKKYDLIPPPTFYRRALVRMDEEWLVKPILDFTEKINDPTKILFPLHRATIYKKLTKTLEINPHGFRKLRATHLVQKYNYNGHQLQKFFGWSNSQPSDYYVKLNVTDLAYGD